MVKQHLALDLVAALLEAHTNWIASENRESLLGNSYELLSELAPLNWRAFWNSKVLICSNLFVFIYVNFLAQTVLQIVPGIRTSACLLRFECKAPAMTLLETRPRHLAFRSKTKLLLRGPLVILQECYGRCNANLKCLWPRRCGDFMESVESWGPVTRAYWLESSN